MYFTRTCGHNNILILINKYTISLKTKQFKENVILVLVLRIFQFFNFLNFFLTFIDLKKLFLDKHINIFILKYVLIFKKFLLY